MAIRITKLLVTLVFIVGLMGYANVAMKSAHNNYIRSKGTGVFKLQGVGGGGTGFLMRGKSGNSFIITNSHVCKLADESNHMQAVHEDVGLRGKAPKQTYDVAVYRHYLYNDLCAMSTTLRGEEISLGDAPVPGQEINVLGHPLLQPLTRTPGELSGLVELEMAISQNTPEEMCRGPNLRYEVAPPFFQIFGVSSLCIAIYEAYLSTAPVKPGNSGSPVLDSTGRVVAVAFATYQGLNGYFVPHHQLKEFLDTL